MAQSVWQTRSQLLSVLVVFWLYLVVGAFVFSAIEQPNAAALHDRFVVAVNEFLVDHPCVLPGSLLNYSTVVVDVYSGGLRWTTDHGFNISKVDDHHWDIVDSLFFSATVITTIGYGHLSPSTDLGRSICILYALFGIPLSGLLVTLIGEQIKKHLLVLWRGLKARLTCPTFAKSTRGRRLTLFTAVVIAIVCFYVVLIIIPAFIFYQVEGWGWLTSHYYSFISFTTIGFGDFVAGDSPKLSHAGRIAYKILLIFYLVLGMGFVAKLLQALQKRNVKRVQMISKRRIIRRIMRRRRGKSRANSSCKGDGDQPDGHSVMYAPSLDSQDQEEFVIFTTMKTFEVDDGEEEHIEQMAMRDTESADIEYETVTVTLHEVSTQTEAMSPLRCHSCMQTDNVHDTGNNIPLPEKTSAALAMATWKITENSIFFECERSHMKRRLSI